MKYTRLSLRDLKDLEKEFVEFLVVNGIEADEWEQLKKEDTAKVEKIIDQFSDVIWEGVLRQASFVEHRTADKLTVCCVKEDQLITLLIPAKEKNFDLTKQVDIAKMIATIKCEEVSLQKDTLKKEPTEQLFELLQAGFYIAKDKQYEQLMKDILKQKK